MALVMAAMVWGGASRAFYNKKARKEAIKQGTASHNKKRKSREEPIKKGSIGANQQKS